MSVTGDDWGRWVRQVWGLLRLEQRRIVAGRRGVALIMLGLVPVALFAMRAAFNHMDVSMAEDTQDFAIMFLTLILRFVLFFAALSLFSSRFASDVQERVLHLYFLSPVRRDVLAVGKYVGALAAGVVLYFPFVTACWFLAYVPGGLGNATQRLADLPQYLAATFLALAGYGALFLLFGLLFRNPAIPALLVWGWELLNPFLPVTLKHFSVIHYVASLCPVPLPAKAIGIIAEPVPAWIAIPGVLLVTAVLLAIAGWRVRRLEVNYGGV